MRELSTLNIRKIMETREFRQDLEFQIESMRKSYLFFKNNSVDGRIKHMATLKKMGKELRQNLEEVPVLHTLYELNKADEEETLRVIKLMIVNLVRFFHTTETMTKDQIEDTAMRIVYTYAGLTLEDVALCFHQAQNSQLGKVFNRVDGPVIMEWLRIYEGQVQEIGTEMNRRLHNNSKTGVWKDGQEHRILQPKRLSELT